MHSTRFDRFAHALIDSASTGPFLRGLLVMKQERQRREVPEPAPLRSAAPRRQIGQEAA